LIEVLAFLAPNYMKTFPKSNSLSINIKKNPQSECISSIKHFFDNLHRFIKWFDYVICYCFATKIGENKVVIFYLNGVFYQIFDDTIEK
jgi:hypothetical protein